MYLEKNLFLNFTSNPDLYKRFIKDNETKEVVFNNIKKFFETEFKKFKVFICPETPKNFNEYIDFKIELSKKIDLLIHAIGNIFITFIEKEEKFKEEDKNLKNSDLFKNKNALKLKYPIKSFNLDDIRNNLNCKDNDLFNICFKNGLDEEKLNEYEKKEDKIREKLKSN
ncbi:hypothetical protein HERIO_2517 [Hepatospora eriocheir]|uniref:Uncharacterized protein n=1 Tax=Hepatospora eriocheir TaxID=1081669 RepID=A0A1X0Q6P2_9MICR|nr:hypothetical protein HERIO_2517 [Hepatospora eriocheir]